MASKSTKASVAIIGSRGIPAAYGGFETIAEALAPKLAERGWNVYVSCEGVHPSQKLAVYKGVKLFYFPLRPFFRVVYETLYDIYSLTRASLSCDCICMLGYGAGLFFFIPRIIGKPLAVNVDGIEWKRPKFNRLEKLLLLISEQAAARFASVLIADSLEIKAYWESKYDRTVHHISYGVDIADMEKPDALGLQNPAEACLELSPSSYWLVVARIEPENNIDTIIRAFLASGSKLRLVIVGDSTNLRYKKYVATLADKHRADVNITWLGPIYDCNQLSTLRQNCFAYIHGHTVGGTNPALLEAMANRALVIAHDNRFNRETGRNCIIYFKDASDLATIMASMELKASVFVELKEAAFSRVSSNYSWDKVVDQYHKLFTELCSRKVNKENQHLCSTK